MMPTRTPSRLWFKQCSFCFGQSDEFYKYNMKLTDLVFRSSLGIWLVLQLFWLHLQWKPVRCRNHTVGLRRATLCLLKGCTGIGKLELAGGDIYPMARLLCPWKKLWFLQNPSHAECSIRSRSACLSSHNEFFVWGSQSSSEEYLEVVLDSLGKERQEG